MRKAGLLLSFLFLASALPAQVIHLWVDGVNGSDKNAGTRAAPFKTLTKGLTTGMTTYKKNVVVHILPAVYGPKTTGDFWDPATKKGKGIALRNIQNFKIVGEDRDKCVVDFNAIGNLKWGLIPIANGVDGLEIRDLTFKNVGNTYQSCGIFKLQAAPPPKHVDIHNNYFVDANWPFQVIKGYNVAFHDNVIVETKKRITSTGANLGWYSARDDLNVYNNVFYNLHVGVGWRLKSQNAHVRICNNIALQCATAFNGGVSTKLTTLENNIAYQCTKAFAITNPPKSNKVTDPKLVNPAKYDFRQAAGSPCLDGGYPKGLLYMANDYYGNARVADGNLDGNSVPDIGVQEAAQAALSVSNFGQGKTAVFQTRNLTSGGFPGIFFLGTKKASLVLNPFGIFGIDPGAILMGRVAPFPGKVTLPIPAMPWTAGTPIYAQAIGFQAKSGGGFVFMPSGILDLYL